MRVPGEKIYLPGQQSTCLIVCFTACLTSLIFQRYRNGFKVDFKHNERVVIPEVNVMNKSSR